MTDKEFLIEFKKNVDFADLKALKDKGSYTFKEVGEMIERAGLENNRSNVALIVWVLQMVL